MHCLDWIIVAGFLAIIAGLVFFIKRYVVTVSDFIAGNRLAGRYLLTMAGEMGQVGAISVVAIWESQYHAGWGATWWSVLNVPFTLIMALSGWVIYRYRQTRSLTLAQFFELRYSKRFRVFSGLLAFISGTINYAIFPSVAARFIIYVCEIPDYEVSAGPLVISLSYAAVMAVLLGMALWITLRAGQVGIMVTDGIQGILVFLALLFVGVYLIRFCGWDHIGEALLNAPNPDTNSMINPFKTSKVRDFNIWFYLIGIFGSFYSRMAWQGTSGYNAAAKSPHEARMAGILASLRSGNIAMIMMFIAMSAYTIMHHPDFTGLAALAQDRILSIINPAVQKQMTVPLVAGTVLPVGLLGCFVAVIISMAITTDDTYLHSWGSIFIQDVILPFRKEPLSQEMHLKFLRWAIFGVAFFAYLFSLLFRQTQYILMFMAITGAIFLGGAGACIIGGLYWKRGTTGGAWAAMLIGSGLAAGGVILQQFPFHRADIQISAPSGISIQVNKAWAEAVDEDIQAAPLEFWKNEEWQSVRVSAVHLDGSEMDGVIFYAYGDKPPRTSVPETHWPDEMNDIIIFPESGSVFRVDKSLSANIYYQIRSLNGRVVWLITMLTAIAAYVIVSLLGRRIYNLNKLLHRGKYATADVPDVAAVRGWRAVFRITDEFTTRDKVVYFLTTAWSMGWVLVYLGYIAANVISVRSDMSWLNLYKWKFYLFLTLGIITAIWFGIGAIRNTIELCSTLAKSRRDETDDGRVEDGAFDEK